MMAQEANESPEALIRRFRDTVWVHYRDHGRGMPWRETWDPYRILVSEIMLQQTQVSRVREKYRQFLDTFPSVEALAAASLQEVLSLWQGLGYNRRAKFLHQAAITIVRDYGGRLPESPEELAELPGIGKNTAGSLAAFAFNRPTVFVETNIRRACIYWFFPERERVPDSELIPWVEATLDRENPREWYYALMDYGAMLKSVVGNPNRRSAHYTRQSPFANSTRQVRGRILRVLTEAGTETATEAARNADGSMMVAELCEAVGFSRERVQEAVDRLEREGFLTQDEAGIRLSE
jgi:A/G-specific adenine glycosylase